MKRFAYSLFLFGIFIIPLESTPIRISTGWNPTAYIPFMSSFILLLIFGFYKDLQMFFSILFKRTARTAFLCLFIFSLLAYMLHGFPSLGILAEETAKLAMMLCFSSLLFFFYTFRHYSLIPLLTFIGFGYSFSLFTGFLTRLGIDLPFFSNNRGGLIDNVGKIAFTFTEPSFVSPHLFGVLLLFLIISFRLGYFNSFEWRRCFLIFAMFLLFAIGSGSSLRLIVDSLMVLVLFSPQVIQFAWIRAQRAVIGWKISKRDIFIVILLLAVISLILTYVVNSNTISVFNRFYSLLDGFDLQLGFDPSTQLRKMRMDVAFQSLQEKFATLVFGGGFANACNITSGLPGSENYTHLSRFYEYNTIIADDCLYLTYSLPVYLLLSFGCLGSFILLYTYTSKELLPELIILLIVSLQFESIAFYSISIYLWRYCSLHWNKTLLK